MTLERDIDILKRVPFFADIPAEPLKLLAFSAETREIGDGVSLFHQGDRADSGYVVMAGRIDLMRETGGRRDPLVSIGAGTLIGELALVIETDRPTGAVSGGRSRVVEIRRQTFRRVLDEYPDVVRALHGRILDRLAALDPEIAAVSTRLAGFDQG